MTRHRNGEYSRGVFLSDLVGLRDPIYVRQIKSRPCERPLWRRPEFYCWRFVCSEKHKWRGAAQLFVNGTYGGGATRRRSLLRRPLAPVSLTEALRNLTKPSLTFIWKCLTIVLFSWKRLINLRYFGKLRHKALQLIYAICIIRNQYLVKQLHFIIPANLVVKIIKKIQKYCLHSQLVLFT